MDKLTIKLIKVFFANSWKIPFCTPVIKLAASGCTRNGDKTQQQKSRPITQ